MTTTERDSLLTSGKHLARAIAAQLMPELSVYFVFQSDSLPAHCKCPNCWGGTSRALDMLARDYLLQRGEWEGRRPCIFIDDLLTLQWATASHKADPVYSLAGWFNKATVSLVLHEMSHVCEQEPDLSEITVKSHEHALALHCYAIAAYSVAQDEGDPAPQWKTHGIDFLRIAMHFRLRALQAGFDPMIQSLATVDARLSCLGAYYDTTLRYEAKSRLRRVPISQLRRIRPHQRILDLWRGDIARWVEKHQPTGRALQACVEAL